MKKVLFGLLAFVVIIGGLGYSWYNTSYGGTERYVKITEDGRKKSLKQTRASVLQIMSTR